MFGLTTLGRIAKKYKQLSDKILDKYGYSSKRWISFRKKKWATYLKKDCSLLYSYGDGKLTIAYFHNCEKTKGIGSILILSLLYRYRDRIDTIELSAVADLKTENGESKLRGFEFWTRFLGFKKADGFKSAFQKYQTRETKEGEAVFSSYIIPFEEFNKYVEEQWE